MARRDVVVIGASAGGVEALSTIVAGLPADFSAAVFVVLHVGEESTSHLPAILNRAGILPAAHAVDREPIRRGRIYVAPPALQTALQHDFISVRRGPRENLHRPSIDVLFRTAAHNYGPRVIGVVLTGGMDDGAAGLEAVKGGGGIAIVQDPATAQMSSMPERALERTEVDYCLDVEAIAPLLRALVADGGDTMPLETPLTGSSNPVPLETKEEATTSGEARRSDELGPPTAFTCPECSGTLFEIGGEEEKGLRFRCRVGHAYSEDTIVPAQNDSVERALWTALRTLEEREAMMSKLAQYARQRGLVALAERYGKKARQVRDDVRRVHDLIVDGPLLDPVAVNATDNS